MNRQRKTLDDATVRLVFKEWHPEPVQAEDGAIIFNAPRPLHGHETWTGKFISGIFYAAVYPDREGSETAIDENIRLDAKRLEYFDRADVEAHARTLADEYGISFREYSSAYSIDDMATEYIYSRSS